MTVSLVVSHVLFIKLFDVGLYIERLIRVGRPKGTGALPGKGLHLRPISARSDAV